MGEREHTEADAVRHDLEVMRDWLDERFRTVDERFKNQNTKMLLYIGVGVGLIRFDLPTPVTATALGIVVAKVVLSVISGFRLH